MRDAAAEDGRRVPRHFYSVSESVIENFASSNAASVILCSFWIVCSFCLGSRLFRGGCLYLSGFEPRAHRGARPAQGQISFFVTAYESKHTAPVLHTG
jgi:hypothetical protein